MTTVTERTQFEKLLAPGQIGSIRTRNRIVKVCGGAEDIGGPSRAFVEAMARGGVGLIIFGDVSPEDGRGLTLWGEAGERMTVRILDDDVRIPTYRKIADASHKHGCPIVMQLFHAGPQALLVGTGMQSVSASSLTEKEVEDLTASMNPHELTTAEVEDLVDKFASTAVRAQKAGFDGVEINAARMHLLNSFLSRAWNKRQDRYGCDTLENRARIVVEIIQETKKRAGQDFAVITLINGIELGIKNGITIEEAQGFAEILEKAGADAIHVRAFGYHGFQSIDAAAEGVYYSDVIKPLPKELDWSHKGIGAMTPLAAAVKKVVSVPVIAVGRMDPVVGEAVLEEGKADFVAMCRRLMADPALPNKLAEGRVDDIAPCAGDEDCTRGMLASIRASRWVPVRCRVNAALGYSQDYEITPALKKKKVVVVGGGPGGMEAARVAAIRGHEVTLFEKEKHLGGLLPWVAMVRGLDVDQDVMVFGDYLKRQIAKLGVKVRLGEEFSPAAIGKIEADAVILAPGGVPGRPQIPGVDGSNVVSVEDLYCKMKDDLDVIEPSVMRGMSIHWQSIGKRVVILGAGIEGRSIADFLAARCREVTLLDPGEIVLRDVRLSDAKRRRLPTEHRYFLQNVTTVDLVKYEEITDSGVVVTTQRKGQRMRFLADTVITATSPRLNTEFFKTLEGKFPEVYLVGAHEDQPTDELAEERQLGLRPTLSGDNDEQSHDAEIKYLKAASPLRNLFGIMNAVGDGYRIAKAI